MRKKQKQRAKKRQNRVGDDRGNRRRTTGETGGGRQGTTGDTRRRDTGLGRIWPKQSASGQLFFATADGQTASGKNQCLAMFGQMCSCILLGVPMFRCCFVQLFLGVVLMCG